MHYQLQELLAALTRVAQGSKVIVIERPPDTARCTVSVQDARR